MFSMDAFGVSGHGRFGERGSPASICQGSAAPVGLLPIPATDARAPKNFLRELYGSRRDDGQPEGALRDLGRCHDVGRVLSTTCAFLLL